MHGSSPRAIATTMTHNSHPTASPPVLAAPKHEYATSRLRMCGRTTATPTWLDSTLRSTR
eukprot:5796593-Pleurochrysis_carterae.AAC.1